VKPPDINTRSLDVVITDTWMAQLESKAARDGLARRHQP